MYLHEFITGGISPLINTWPEGIWELTDSSEWKKSGTNSVSTHTVHVLALPVGSRWPVMSFFRNTWRESSNWSSAPAPGAGS